ncbi:MAG: hypothetical protein WAO19_06495 [Candidatus Kryptoniota bacterium]
MTWNELYPVVTEHAKFAVLRYEERRQRKIQELLWQSFEKYQSEIPSGRGIKKQSYKCGVKRSC